MSECFRSRVPGDTDGDIVVLRAPKVIRIRCTPRVGWVFLRLTSTSGRGKKEWAQAFSQKKGISRVP